ncbi:MAG: MlaD family protein [Proteobacteria bacterium]|nr:MlaD family protein [Pseudomonadota bacterium]
MRWFSRLITLVVLAGVATALVLFVRARLPTTTVGQDFTTYAKFRDASKLVVGSPVMIAGVRIGEISRLTIEGALARVDMRLRDDTDVPVDSFVTKRAPATFGDSYLEIIPAGGEFGSPTSRKLVSTEPLLHVIEGGSTDTALRATARQMPQIEAAFDSFRAFMEDSRAWVNGALVGNLTTVDDWLEHGSVQRPLQQADDALEKIERATAVATDALGGTDRSLQTLTKIETKIRDTRAQLHGYRDSLLVGFADSRKAMDQVDAQIDQAHQVMAAIANGSGDV